MLALTAQAVSPLVWHSDAAMLFAGPTFGAVSST